MTVAYTKPICRGSEKLGTLCGTCERCEDIARMYSVKPARITPMPTTDAAARERLMVSDAFWSKVGIAARDECWLWRGAKNVKGYGNFRSKSAHVVAFALANGEPAKGLTIDHLCRNRSCVNPLHLEAVSLQENIRRHTSTITHCKHGHELGNDNITMITRPDGIRRRCKVCHVRQEIKRRARRKAEKSK